MCITVMPLVPILIVVALLLILFYLFARLIGRDIQFNRRGGGGGHYQEEHSTIGQTSVDGFAHGADILVGNEVELGDFP